LEAVDTRIKVSIGSGIFPLLPGTFMKSEFNKTGKKKKNSDSHSAFIAIAHTTEKAFIALEIKQLQFTLLNFSTFFYFFFF
jgi:hypothetical protein